MTFLLDLRHALRSLLRAPTFTLVALLTLALGIGAQTAVMSVIKQVFVEPLPYTRPHELVYVHVDNTKLFPDRGFLALPAPYFRLLRERQQAFSELAIFSYPRHLSLRGQGETSTIMGLGVTGSFFPLLGVKPHLGRTLLPSDEGAKAVVLTHALWRGRFNGDPAILGRLLNLGGQDFAVVGVLSSTFHWQYDPAYFTSDGPTPQDMQAQWGPYIQNTLGRLKPGVDLAQARADLARVHGNLVQDMPRLAEAPLLATPYRTFLYGEQKARGLMLGLTGGLVLLIACTNLANLMAGRALQRQQETALRQALGGTRMDSLRPFLAEGFLLALGGAGAGMALSLVLRGLLLPLVPDELQAAPALDLPLVLLALVTALGAGLLGTLLAASLASSRNLVTPLKEGGKTGPGQGRPWIRQALVAAQVALSLCLLAAFGVLFQSLHNLDRAPLGFTLDRALALRFTLDPRNHPSPEGRAAQVRQILAAARELPGVTHAALSRRLPPDYLGKESFSLPGAPQVQHTAFGSSLTPGALEALGMTLLKGRDFSASDRTRDPDHLLVSRSLAERCWPGQDPIGKGLVIPYAAGPRTLTVVGLVEDVRFDGPRGDRDLAALFAPMEASEPAPTYLVVRTLGDPRPMIPVLRARLKALDPNLPTSGLHTLRSRLANHLERDRQQVQLLGVLAAFALALAASGLYGVMAHTVTQRTREIGIRKALGGQNAQMVWEIVRRALAVIALGLGTGALLTLASGRLLASLVFGVSAADPLLLALAALTLGLVALLAALIPASRAARVQPATALRAE